MSAYMIVEIEVKDPVGYEEYKNLAHASLMKYEGKYIVRGGKAELIEGQPTPKRLVVLEFENAAKAKTWRNSPEYKEAMKIRHATAETRMILVEGV